MKKLIFIISLIFVFAGVQSQDFALSPRASYEAYTGTAADTVSGTNSISKTINIGKDYLYYYEVLADIDTLTGGGGYGVSCVLQGSNDNVNFSTITDVTFAASADTIIRYTNLSATATQTIASYNITATDSILYDDTLTVAAQTITVPSEPGVMWQYLKLVLTGDDASTYAELEAIRVKIVKVP